MPASGKYTLPGLETATSRPATSRTTRSRALGTRRAYVVPRQRSRRAEVDLPRTAHHNTRLRMANILTRLFGSANERMLRKLWPIVEEVHDLEAGLAELPPEAFPERTAELREA